MWEITLFLFSKSRTAWRLKDALSHNHCGYIYEEFPARDVEPATREIMVGRKQVGAQMG